MREYSIGDYVLNGGEVAVSVMLEAITRLLPGFMGNAASIVEESYTGENALLEHRQYTKPADWRGIKVPDVLLSATTRRSTVSAAMSAGEDQRAASGSHRGVGLFQA